MPVFIDLEVFLPYNVLFTHIIFKMKPTLDTHNTVGNKRDSLTVTGVINKHVDRSEIHIY